MIHYSSEGLVITIPGKGQHATHEHLMIAINTALRLATLNPDKVEGDQGKLAELFFLQAALIPEEKDLKKGIEIKK